MNTSATPPSPLRGDATREALIAAALAIFARDGFDAASTRAIAEQAGVNQALIGYHFGGKEGLYLAVFDHITAELQARIGPVVADMQTLLTNPPKTTTAAARRKAWLPPILGLTDAALAMILSPETEHWAELMMREQARPSLAFDNIYNGFMGPTLNVLTELVMRLRDESDHTLARLRVIGMFSQAIVWRNARATAFRLLGWQKLGAAELEMIKRNLHATLQAQLLN